MEQRNRARHRGPWPSRLPNGLTAGIFARVLRTHSPQEASGLARLLVLYPRLKAHGGVRGKNGDFGVNRSRPRGSTL
jgi:hypothetical protein